MKHVAHENCGGTFAHRKDRNYSAIFVEVIMAATWIVSANAGRARIFAMPTATAPLQEINDMLNSAARLRTAATESDELGQRSAGKSQHNVGASTPTSGYQPNQSPAEHQTELFARSIADFLLRNFLESRFKSLHLIAGPEFLGALRKQLNTGLESVVDLTINKDYTRLNADQLREQIQSHTAKQ
jgi:protein required for attachment to host cells